MVDININLLKGDNSMNSAKEQKNQNQVVEEKAEQSSWKELMQKNVSTLLGGIIIGGVALLFLLTLLIIWLAR